MRLAIYVPKAQADRWSPSPGSISFGELQTQLVSLAGQITVTAAKGIWRGPRDGIVQEAVFVVEAFVASGNERKALTWGLLRAYAEQLLREGEESVLIVQDNEPTLIT